MIIRNEYATQKSNGCRMIEARIARAKRAENFPVRRRMGLAVRGSLMGVKRKSSTNPSVTPQLLGVFPNWVKSAWDFPQRQQLQLQVEEVLLLLGHLVVGRKRRQE
ncbi:hypothetical protein JRO89_XS13G0068800 [Xanthoceras sorbifolium]|uniref:Uncharacterized protein n=1 Tax=Xanthoceras sorbifolium TaxID=99658 RepID=A0ABQ8H710_9ROSI|nr:hypothetical protein JRO89_XS13G0068800 [Xanthoceras sorbifolium]